MMIRLNPGESDALTSWGQEGLALDLRAGQSSPEAQATSTFASGPSPIDRQTAHQYPIAHRAWCETSTSTWLPCRLEVVRTPRILERPARSLMTGREAVIVADPAESVEVPKAAEEEVAAAAVAPRMLIPTTAVVRHAKAAAAPLLALLLSLYADSSLPSPF